MEGSNECDNQIMQYEKNIICINDKTKVDKVMEERENPRLQTEINKVSRECENFDKEKIKHILE
jgi:hypothetical protein